MAVKRTAVVANFRDPAEEEAAARLSASFLLEASNRPGDESFGYFRVHPSVSGLAIQALSGKWQMSQSGMLKHVEEYTAFAENTLVQVRYPQPKNMVWAVEGIILGESKPSWDSDKNAFVSKSPITCLIKVEYDAPYDLCTAHYAACPVTTATVAPKGDANPDDGADAPGRPPTLVAASKGTVRKSLSMTPPPCPPSDADAAKAAYFRAMFDTKAEFSRILIEENNSAGPKFAGATEDVKYTSTTGVVPFTVLRCYPSGPDSITSTSGVLMDMGSEVEAMEDNLVFSGGGSSNLKYPNTGSSISVAAIGSFIDDKGRTFTPQFAKPGEMIYVPTYGPLGGVIKTTKRVVGPGEIAAVKDGLAVLGCYGVANAIYQASFQRYFLKFVAHPTKSDEYQGAMVVAHKDKLVGSLKVDPPPRRGRK